MACACCVCNQNFADLDVPVKCDSCKFQAHSKCSGLAAGELKCITLKNLTLKYFCPSCEKGLRNIPELKQLINRLLADVNELKLSKGVNKQISEDFIINELNDRSQRASNLIIYNIQESTALITADKIKHDELAVSNIIASIITESAIEPLKLIRLGKHYQPNSKPRPIKIVLPSSRDAFDILRNKKKLQQNQPTSEIFISSDRTLYQRNSMNKLRDELNTRISNGENDLTIKYIKGVQFSQMIVVLVISQMVFFIKYFFIKM